MPKMPDTMGGLIPWQWEQGRLEYFQFENLRLMSGVLLRKEGMLLSSANEDAELRELAGEVGIRFHPEGYTVWRNYARVYKAALLATSVPAGGGTLTCTKICRDLAKGNIGTADDYLTLVMRSFYLNGPVFHASSYRPGQLRIFPFCSALRLLIAKAAQGDSPPCLSPGDIKNHLFSRNITGDEDWHFFQQLDARNIPWVNQYQQRQVREMLIFAGQCSFLKWDGKCLCLDMPAGASTDNMKSLFAKMAPIKNTQKKTAHEEILQMGTRGGAFEIVLPPKTELIIAGEPLISVKEGIRRAVNHIIVERSPKLRSMFFGHNPAAVCDITLNPKNCGFPWSGNLLEIHHITPLSSSVRAEREGTSMNDLVALTPTAHKAVHEYYRQWLQKRKRKDFVSREEARHVYDAAKDEYQRRTGVR